MGRLCWFDSLFVLMFLFSDTTERISITFGIGDVGQTRCVINFGQYQLSKAKLELIFSKMFCHTSRECET